MGPIEEVQKLLDECNAALEKGPFIARNRDGSLNQEITSTLHAMFMEWAQKAGDDGRPKE